MMVYSYSQDKQQTRVAGIIIFVCLGFVCLGFAFHHFVVLGYRVISGWLGYLYIQLYLLS